MQRRGLQPLGPVLPGFVVLLAVVAAPCCHCLDVLEPLSAEELAVLGALEALEGAAVPLVPVVAAQSGPAAGPDEGGEAGEVLTFVLDFKDSDQGRTTAINGIATGAFDETAFGFPAGPTSFGVIAGAVLGVVEADFGGELGQLMPSGMRLRLQVVLGDIGAAPPKAGASQFFYVQIGSDIDGVVRGLAGLACVGCVRKSTGTGPTIPVGAVVASVFTNNLGRVLFSTATEPDLDAVKHAIAGSISHEIGHTLSLLHINQAGVVTPSGLPPLLGTWITQAARLANREFSISGSFQDVVHRNIDKLIAAVGLMPLPPVCGDGVRQDPEECDDGNTTGNDGCTKKCKVQRGFKCRGRRGRRSKCKVVCGDGILVRRAGEECDTGESRRQDGCTRKCKVSKGWLCRTPRRRKPSVCERQA